MKKQAIVSVYDKTGLEEFVGGLVELGIGILSTGGTAKFLKEKGIPVQSISDYTQSPEILEGRVKSLHPRIHGGILARRDREDDLRELQANAISEIDFVVVNLYPFVQQVRRIEEAGDAGHESLVEFIDIGGPTMIRAAAKNCRFVAPICDPADYPVILAELRQSGSIAHETRQRLAAKVFRMMAAYDGAIARYFSLAERLLTSDGSRVKLAPVESITLQQEMTLRYGENPHQTAGLYRRYEAGEGSSSWWRQIQGKEISYNNLLDMHGALDLFLEVSTGLDGAHAAVIIKHTNPCGAAVRKTALEAFRAAWSCDPLSAFGGIVAVSGVMTKELAEAIVEGFVEVVISGEVSPEGAAVFAKKKNVRLIECSLERYRAARSSGVMTMRNFYGDYLVQTADNELKDLSGAKVAAGETPTAEQMQDFELAWKVCKHVKSNAIVIVKDRRAIGVGAGQMSRVDSAKLAVQRAGFHGHSVAGAVAASDAFLPFPDTLEILNDAGVVGLVQPGGSIKDEDVVESAKKRSVVMLVTGERHFRH
ncbi:MAG TPA: bifunctional phosphoribosylaminoimidazolecarboxamide formyltransferase/IMP cyclohydrolase [Oligoflexia bacterium]|nr:bifunctional phosphoribosylaminoimidazolecarboxamide formyltransferase/IMP cyclohydrolase [Oligoflexia bacterium]